MNYFYFKSADIGKTWKIHQYVFLSSPSRTQELKSPTAGTSTQTKSGFKQNTKAEGPFPGWVHAPLPGVTSTFPSSTHRRRESLQWCVSSNASWAISGLDKFLSHTLTWAPAWPWEGAQVLKWRLPDFPPKQSNPGIGETGCSTRREKGRVWAGTLSL